MATVGKDAFVSVNFHVISCFCAAGRRQAESELSAPAADAPQEISQKWLRQLAGISLQVPSLQLLSFKLMGNALVRNMECRSLYGFALLWWEPLEQHSAIAHCCLQHWELLCLRKRAILMGLWLSEPDPAGRTVLTVTSKQILSSPALILLLKHLWGEE